MPDYLFFTILAIAVGTTLYTRRMLKKTSAAIEAEGIEGTSEVARGLAKLGASTPDYSGAVSIIRDEAKAAFRGYYPLEKNAVTLSAIVADCNDALNKGKIGREKFIDLQGAYLRVNTQKG